MKKVSSFKFVLVILVILVILVGIFPAIKIHKHIVDRLSPPIQVGFDPMEGNIVGPFAENLDNIERVVWVKKEGEHVPPQDWYNIIFVEREKLELVPVWPESGQRR
jgi:hypothetical protein